jgi:hypothetical protein
VEIPLFGSEFVVSRISTVLILEIRYILCSLSSIGWASVDDRRKYVIDFEYYSSFKCLEKTVRG